MKFKGFSIALCLCLLTVNGLVLGQEPSDPLSVRGAFAQALDEHDVDKMLSLFADDGVFYVNYVPELMDTKEKISAYFSGVFAGAPDAHTTEGIVLTKDNIVVVDHSMIGTDTGEGPGLPTTGKPWNNPHLDIYEIEDGKIKRLTSYADIYGYFVQLGMAPAPDLPPLAPSILVPDPEPTGLSPMEANAEQIRRWNVHDVPLIAQALDTDLQMFAGPLGAPLDRNAVTAINEMYFAAFPDIQHEVIRTIDLGEGWVVTELVARSTHQGAFIGIPAMGYPSEIEVVWLMRYNADGLITQGSFYYDNQTFMTQLTTAPWPLDGIWITTYPMAAGNLISTTVYTAQDAAKTQYSGTLEFLNSFGPSGLFPDADPSLDVYAGGQAVMVGRDKYAATYLGYHRKFDPDTGIMEIVGISTVAAQFELLGPNLLQGHGMRSFYMAAQDADQDGIPDEGEEPFFCYSPTWTGKRLTALPGCTPAPVE
jgi:steroid delta-isomerase-like uncharacterized protein